MSQTVQSRGTAGTAVAGPFTVRDIVVGVGVFLLFLSSVVPIQVLRGIGLNLWNSADLFQLGLGILLPAVVLVLFVVRRLAPGLRLRVGSLSVDQFASVVASLALAFYFLAIVNVYSVVGVVGFIGALVLFAGTVCARWIPQLAADFEGRPEMPAHPVARDSLPAAARPAPSPAGSSANHARFERPSEQGGAPDGASRTGVHQPPAAQYAAPSGSGAAGVAGAAAAAHAAQSSGAPAESAGGSAADPAARPENAAEGARGERNVPEPRVPREPAEEVSPGAADGEAVGIPVTEDASGSSTRDAAVFSAGGELEESGNQFAGVGSRPAGHTGNPAATGTHDEAAAAVEERHQAPAADEEKRAAMSVHAGGPVGGAAGATSAMPPVAETRGAGALADAVGGQSPISATREHYAEAEEEYEAFWFAVGRTRPVYDESTGQVMFTVEPGSWILALQDRGDEFLVQHTDGRVGVLRDLTNIERA